MRALSAALLVSTARWAGTAPWRAVCDPRHRATRASIFPEGDETPAAAASGTKAQPPLSEDMLVGFWTIYDNLATADALNAMSAGDEMSDSFLSASIVLRADGSVSRGSDFPGGVWSLQSVRAAVDAGTASPASREAARLRMVLESRLLRQEWRYEGLAFQLELPQEPMDASRGGVAPDAPTQVTRSLRVVGNASRWDVSDADAPRRIETEGSIGPDAEFFSMVKKEVDRRKLTPTIQPFAGQVDPEGAERRERRGNDRKDAEVSGLKEAIEGVRAAKATDPDDWRSKVKVVEGVDYWRVGEEPRSNETDTDGNDAR